MPVSRYVTLRTVKHSGSEFPVGAPMALSDDYAAPLLAIGAIQAQAGALPVMPTVPGDVVRETVDTGSGGKARAYVEAISSAQGVVFQEDMKYALYESGGRVSFGSELESSSFGATGRFEVATIVIPPQFCEPGTAVEVDFQFACSANTVTKTFLVCPTENQVDKVDISRLKGASAVYDAALGVASVMAKAYFDIVSRDVVKGGQVSATSGYGSVTSAAAKNPRTLPLNSRRGIAIALGVDIGAAQTGTADIAITTGVFTKTAHGLAVGQPIILSGAPPAPLVAGERYFVSAVLSADTWAVSDTTTGTPISTTAAGAAVAYSAYSVATLTRARATVFKE